MKHYTSQELLLTLSEGPSRNYWRKQLQQLEVQGWEKFAMDAPNARYRITRPHDIALERRKEYVYVICPSSGGRWGKSRNDRVVLGST